MTTILVSIGNSDDELAQAEWAEFCRDVSAEIAQHEHHRYGEWFSAPNSQYQNAAWAFNIHAGQPLSLKEHLRRIARLYRQDSIAWLEGKTEFIQPDGTLKALR